MLTIIRVYEKCKKCFAPLNEFDRHGTLPKKRSKSGTYFEKWKQCSNSTCGMMYMSEADKRREPGIARSGNLFEKPGAHKFDAEKFAAIKTVKFGSNAGKSVDFALVRADDIAPWE